MLKNIAITAIATLMIMSATPTFSQTIEIGPGGVRLVDPDQEMRPIRRDDLSERQAVRIARSEGLYGVDSVKRRRNVIIVRGVDRNDYDMKVVIDRRTGDVLSID